MTLLAAPARHFSPLHVKTKLSPSACRYRFSAGKTGFVEMKILRQAASFHWRETSVKSAQAGWRRLMQ
jgi:hypothetical protein